MKIKYTLHAESRMRKRSISEDEVLQTIMYPDKTEKKEGKYFCKKDIGRAKIEVVYEKDTYINIITVYYI